MFDHTRPVTLFKTFIGRGGNLYSPGIYLPGTLPSAAYNSTYCVQDAVVTTVPIVEKNELVINPTTDATTVDIKIQQSKSSFDVPKLAINTSTEEAISELKGIGKGTSKKVVAYREQSPFVDYQDLNARVPLTFGRQWEDYSISFDIE